LPRRWPRVYWAPGQVGSPDHSRGRGPATAKPETGPAWRDVIPLLLALALCLPALSPLLLPGFVEGHDGIEHVFRVLALATAWRESGVVGNLLPRWTPDLALGFGYPLFGLYSPLAYVIPAGLTLLGVAPIVAVKVAVALALLLGGLGAFLCLRPLAGATAAVAGAVTYVYAPYTLANAYVRLDLAELTAGSCAALALAALLRLGGAVGAGAAGGRVVLAALTLAAIPLCHNLSVLTFLPLLAVVWCSLLVQAWRQEKPAQRRRAVLPVVAAPLLGAGLAAFFLLPAWRWQAATQLALLGGDPAFLAKLLHPLALWRAHFALPGWGWFGAGSAWWNFSLAPGSAGEFGAGPSTLAWLAVPVSLILLRWRSQRRGLALALVIACVVSVLLLTSLALPFWRAFSHLTLLQFPWRFAGPLCLATALLVGLLLASIPVRWRLLPAAACVALAVVPALLYLRPDAISLPTGAITWPTQLRRELIGGYGTTGSGLFLPRWAPGQSPQVPVFAAPTSGATSLQLTGLTGRADVFTANYRALQPATLTLGAWYFPGWRVRIDGHAVPAAPDASGLLRLSLPAGTHRLTVARGPTGAELVGGVVTLAAALVAIVLLLGPGRPALIVAVITTLASLALSGAVPRFSFSMLGNAASVWSIPPTQMPSQPLQAVAWRIVHSPVWGPTPVLEVAWLARQAPVGDVQPAIQVRSLTGEVLASTTRGPRLGTVSTTGWPAGALIFDHLTIPLPPAVGGVCAGTYDLALAMGTTGAAPTALGQVSLPCAPANVPTAPQVVAPVLHGLSAGRLPTVQPGGAVDLDLSLRVPGPTATDEVLAFQLLDGRGQPVAQVQSYGNVDLRFSTLWTAGQVVPYRLHLPLPGSLATGVYTLSLQLFSPAGDALQPLLAPTGQIGPKLTLATVKVAPARAANTGPMLARFGPSIGLLAPAGQPRPVLAAQPGATVSIPLRWLAVGAPTTDETVFVHLVDAKGKLVAQADGPPLADRYPTSAWDAGELIDDTRQLPLPANLPPGRYTVQVGWYLPGTGARLPVSPPVPDNALPVADVVVRAVAKAG
jgi:hypothetical protein